MPPAGMEPTSPTSERPLTHASDRAATGFGSHWELTPDNCSVVTEKLPLPSLVSTGTYLLTHSVFIETYLVPMLFSLELTLGTILSSLELTLDPWCFRWNLPSGPFCLHLNFPWTHPDFIGTYPRTHSVFIETYLGPMLFSLKLTFRPSLS
jgi:hypothetical protein